MSQNTTIQVDPQELRDTATHFRHSSAEIERITTQLRNAAADLDTGCWPAGEAERLTARIADADAEGRRLARQRAEMGDTLMRAADAFEQADMATVQASMGLAPGSGRVPGLASPVLRDQTPALKSSGKQPWTVDKSKPAPWEDDGFAWWAEAFERDHGRPPTVEDYEEFRLSWYLSGEGAVEWTDADWEAFYYARLAGLEAWLGRGVVFTGAWTGAQILAQVEALNAIEATWREQTERVLGLRDGLEIAPPPAGLQPWVFSADWPDTNIPLYLDGRFWRVNNDLRDALNDPNAPLTLIEDFYRYVVAPGLIARGAPDAGLMVLRCLSGETSDWQVSERLGRELMELVHHQDRLAEQEVLAMQAARQIAENLAPGETATFEYESPPLGMKAYNPDEYDLPNSTYTMADHTGWFKWEGTIERRRDGTWVVRGTLNRDLADYADWHGHPHDYDGDGTTECPGKFCGKTARFDIEGFRPDNWMPDLPRSLDPIEAGLDRVYERLVPPGQDTNIVIPDEWMARLVLGGKASNPGFQMNFNAQEDYKFVVSDWSNLPDISYENLRCGDEYRIEERDVTPAYGLPPHWTP